MPSLKLFSKKMIDKQIFQEYGKTYTLLFNRIFKFRRKEDISMTGFQFLFFTAQTTYQHSGNYPSDSLLRHLPI